MVRVGTAWRALVLIEIAGGGFCFLALNQCCLHALLLRKTRRKNRKRRWNNVYVMDVALIVCVTTCMYRDILFCSYIFFLKLISANQIFTSFPHFAVIFTSKWPCVLSPEDVLRVQPFIHLKSFEYFSISFDFSPWCGATLLISFVNFFVLLNSLDP